MLPCCILDPYIQPDTSDQRGDNSALPFLQKTNTQMATHSLTQLAHQSASDKTESIVDPVSSVFSRSPNRTRVCIYNFVQIRILVCCIVCENVLNGKKQTNPKVQFPLCWLGISENANFYFWLQKGLIIRAFVTKFSGLLFEREMWL